MSENYNRSGFVASNDPELFPPSKWNANVSVSFDDNVVPETQYSISDFRYVSPYKRDDAVIHFDLNGKSFFKKVFQAFPLSKTIQFHFNEKQIDTIIEQTRTHSFSVTIDKDIFDNYSTKSSDILLSISSKLFLHIINELKKENDLMRFFYNGDGSDLIVDILGSGEFKSQYIPTISCYEYRKLSSLDVEKELEIIISPLLLLRVLKSTDKQMKVIGFSFLCDSFEIILKTKSAIKVVNVCYSDSVYVYKVTRLKDINLSYPISPFYRVQKALKISNEVNISIYKNGLIDITVLIKSIKDNVAAFKLYVVPQVDVDI